MERRGETAVDSRSALHAGMGRRKDLPEMDGGTGCMLPEHQRLLWVSVFESIAEGIMITDGDGVILSANPGFARITGYGCREVVGRNPRFLRSDRHEPEFYLEMWRMLESTGGWAGEFWNVRKNGELYAQETSIVAVRGEDGGVTHYVAVFRDVTARKEMEETLVRLSSLDGLTGLANRRIYDDALVREWRRAARAGTPLSLIMADIDLFKKYNDTYGHLEGDDCLRAVAKVLEESVRRPGDLAARYGGEEFAVLLAETDAAAAVAIAEKIRKSVEAIRIPHHTSEVGSHVTISLGVSTTVPRPGEAPEVLARSSDAALYAAKTGGRNRVVLLRPAEETGRP